MKKFIFTLLLPVGLGLTGCMHGRNSADQDTAANTSPTANIQPATNADNTSVNVVDHTQATVTPVDQGNSQADIDTTAKIRKAIVDGTDYSTLAKNIKIITRDGNVTLRGPVETDTEKSSIVSIAKNIAGQDNVTDQLEIKMQ